MARQNDDFPLRLVGLTRQQLLEELDEFYVDALPSDNESIVSDVTDSEDEDSVDQSKTRGLTPIVPMSESEEEEDDEGEDDVPLSVLAEAAKKLTTKTQKPPVWDKCNRPPSPSSFVADSGVPDFIKTLDDITPYELFRLFFTDDFINHLMFQTNLYTQRQHLVSGKNFSKTNVAEMKTFLGINLLMGIKRSPSYKDYWSSAPDLHDPFISAAMSLNRFSWLLSHLHVSDNSLMPACNSPDHDKLYKLRPMLEHLSTKFAQCLLPSEVLALDKSMIKFKGRSIMKQYMPKKPIKRGYKVWMLCDKSAYCLKFDIYTGKASSGEVEKNLGSRVVTKLMDGFERKDHKLFFDNFFTSVELMEGLNMKGIHAVGTVNISRRHMPKFKSDKQLKRGEFDWYTSDSKLFAFKWKDKRSVHLLSNYHRPEDCAEVNRKGKDGTIAKVPCPKALIDYNSNMNGVDRFDQLLSSYKINRQSQKWWHRIFFYFLDACVVNSYCIHKQLDLPRITAKNFRRSIIGGLTAETFVSSKRKSRSDEPKIEIKKSKPFVPKEVRLTSSSHQPERTTRRRCALCSTKVKQVRTDWKCTTCNVPLCLGKEKTCFQTYHSKQ